MFIINNFILYLLKRMIKSQFKTIGSPDQSHLNRSFQLAIHDIQMLNQVTSKQHYIIISSQKSGKSWISPAFNRKLPDIWEIQVDYFSVTAQLFLKGNQNNQSLARTTIISSYGENKICFLYQLNKPQNKICAINYKLFEKKSDNKQQKKNYFQNNSNIFDSFVNQNDISRVQNKQVQKYKTIQVSFERVAFQDNNDFSVLSQFDSKNTIQKRNFQKYEKNQNSDQYNKVNESFENFDDQRHRFQGHLNDSMSFIEQLIKNMPENQIINNTPVEDNLSKVNQENNESEEQYTTAQRWYTDKYKKKNRYKKKIHLGSESLSPLSANNDKNMIKTTVIKNEFIEKEEVLRQLSDLSTDQTVLSKQIDVSILAGGVIQQICVLSRNDDLCSNQWNSTVALPKQGTILIKCHSKAGQLNGCIGSQEIKKGFCYLFDDEGNNHGNFNFKCKSICNFVVQTFDIIQNSSALDNEKSDIQQQRVCNNSNLVDQNNDKSTLSEDRANQQQSKHNNNEQTTNKLVNQRIDKLVYQKEDIDNIEEDKQKQKKREEEATQQQRKRMIQQQKRQQEMIRQREEEIKRREQQERERKELQQQRINQELQKRERIRSNVKKMQMKKFGSINLTIQPTKSLSQSQDIGSPQGGSLPIQANSEHNANFIKRDNTYTLPLMNRQQTINRDEDSPIPARNPGTAGTNSLAEQELRQQLSKIPSLTLEHNLGKDESSIIEREVYTRLNQTQMSKYSIHQKGKHINLKIASIDLNLHNPNHKGKILKMQIDNNVYYTETSKQLYFLTWKGKGYFFPNTPKNSIFHLQLLQERQGMQYSLGTCKIYLRVFNTDEHNKILSYQDFIRNENQQSVGRVTINYENLQKRGRSLESNVSMEFRDAQTSRLSKNARLQIQRASNMSTKKKRTKQNSFRISTQSSKAQQFISNRNDSRRLVTNLGRNQFNLNDSIFSRLKSKPPLTKRKYTGGNVVIPKAHRFREQNTLFYGDPGPGSYEIESSFDRHASPL